VRLGAPLVAASGRCGGGGWFRAPAAGAPWGPAWGCYAPFVAPLAATIAWGGLALLDVPIAAHGEDPVGSGVFLVLRCSMSVHCLQWVRGLFASSLFSRSRSPRPPRGTCTALIPASLAQCLSAAAAAWSFTMPVYIDTCFGG